MLKILKKTIKLIADSAFNKDNELDKIKRAAIQTIVAPFNGESIIIQVRSLNYVELKACGDVNVINYQEEKKEPDMEQLVELINTQEKICQNTLVSPTYDEIVNAIYETDKAFKKAKDELPELKKMLEDSKLHAAEKRKLQTKIYETELLTGFILPGDFTGFIVAWALGVERSDVKKVTRDMLLEAALLAKNGKDNPIDHLEGKFNKMHKEQINIAAWNVLSEWEKEREQQREFENQYKKKGLKLKNNIRRK